VARLHGKRCAMRLINPVVIMAAGKGSRMRAEAQVPPELLAEAQSRPKAMIRLGRSKLPLLELLLLQAQQEGADVACLVIAQDDTVTAPHFENNPVPGLLLSFVRQSIPEGRSKPLGTAHAVELALLAHPQWEGLSVAVANGDNLPPRGMFRALFQNPSAVPAFDPDHLGLPPERVLAFAVFHRDGQGKLTGITEKPSAEELDGARWSDGKVRVSMNYFRLPYTALLEAVRKAPLSPVRDEKELPVAVSQWIASGGEVRALSMAGQFLDLTHPEDIAKANAIIDAGGHGLLG